MQIISATDAKQGLSAALNAAQREPVFIQRQKRNVAVLLSVQEYEKLTEANRRDLLDLCDVMGAKAKKAGLTEAILDEILKQ